MTHPNIDLNNKFFEAYGKRDLDGLRTVLAEDAKWTALGEHPLSGVRNGFAEVIAFFDRNTLLLRSPGGGQFFQLCHNREIMENRLRG
jgi:ketosteroid isomerase-like protein